MQSRAPSPPGKDSKRKAREAHSGSDLVDSAAPSAKPSGATTTGVRSESESEDDEDELTESDDGIVSDPEECLAQEERGALRVLHRVHEEHDAVRARPS